MNALNIEIYSDLICPWCYIGKRRMEAGLKLLSEEFMPEIVWRPFQLNPDMPVAGMNRKAYRTKKFGSWDRSLAMDAEVSGLEIKFVLMSDLKPFPALEFSFNPFGVARAAWYILAVMMVFFSMLL